MAVLTDKAKDKKGEEDEDEIVKENEERRVEESAIAGPQEVVALKGRVENPSTLSNGGRAFRPS